MIVKVVPAMPAGEIETAAYFEVSPPVRCGLYYFGEEDEKKRNYYQDLGFGVHGYNDVRIHSFAVDSKVFKDHRPGQPDELRQYPVRFARWSDPETGKIEAVVTSGNIYLIDHNGKTIDKVR